MKPTILILATTFALAGTPALAEIQTVTLDVDKMTCASCPVVVKGALNKLDGVTGVVTSLEDKTAVVTYDDDKLTLADLTTATTNAGFPSVAHNAYGTE